MFGRVRRAVAALPGSAEVRASAILHVYNPAVIASLVAIGMGAAGVSFRGTRARTADRGRGEQQRYLRWPGRVLVLVTPDAVVIRDWTAAQGIGRELARWPNGTFSATKVRYIGQVGVRVVLRSGQVAVLTGRRSSLHPSIRATVEAIVSAG